MLLFYKYQGAGNDFIVIDNREGQMNDVSKSMIARLCDRRFGIGADGLMLLQLHPDYDFEMLYYNANGLEGSMCGNGGRCIVAFAQFLGIIEDKTQFLAVDGAHEAFVPQESYVELKMGAVSDLQLSDTYCYLDTGSPHYVEFVPEVVDVDVVTRGRAIRYNDTYREKGVNVNFVEIEGPDRLLVATYERGVEDETLACGTGVTAAALAYFLQHTSRESGQHGIHITVKGGKLEVRFTYEHNNFSDIWLCGPAEQVFVGTIGE